MTDVAAVSGQVNANAGSGTAKSGGAKGGGSALGAFAAIFGKAGGKGAGEAAEAATAKAAAQAKPGAKTLDPAPKGDAAVAEIDPQAVLADAGVPTDVTTEPDADAKPHKSGTRRKSDTDQTDASVLPLMGAFAAVVAHAPPATQGQAQQGVATVAGVRSIQTATPIATDATATANAATMAATIKSETDSGKTAPDKDAKPAVVADTQPKGAAPQPATPANTVAVNTAGQHGGQTPDQRHGGGQAKDQGQSASQRPANDDARAPIAIGSLQDIVQSLPPVLQSQLSTAGVGSLPVAATPLSTSDQLSDRAIDMSVSGQWIDRMAQEIATLASGTGHSSFQLSPPNLGKIQVDLWQGDDKTNVRILAETDEATRRLRDGQGALEDHARMSSLSLGSVSVEKSSTPFDGNARDQNSRQNPDSSGAGQQQQQASAQAQGQSAQNRSGNTLNRGSFDAVMGQEQEVEADPTAGMTRASDPGVRFA